MISLERFRSQRPIAAVDFSLPVLVGNLISLLKIRAKLFSLYSHNKLCLYRSMVRNVKSISERFESEAKPRRRHSISHPPDNIGVSCTVETNSSREKILTGRRRSLAVPRDNIGVSCLPTAERLGNILEVPEYESSGEEEGKKSPLKPSKNRRSFPQATKARLNLFRDDAISNNQSTTSSTERDPSPDRALRFDRGRSCKRRDTVGLLCHEGGKESFKKCSESKKAEHKIPIEMGISNVRRPKDDPTKPRKPILPRDNIGFACRPLHKSTGRLSGPGLSTGVNLKSSSNGMERKSHLHAKQPTLATRNERITGEQMKTLRAVSKISVLLLYMHFLLTYYLSFSKSHRYEEIFASCPPRNVHE